MYEINGRSILAILAVMLAAVLVPLLVTSGPGISGFILQPRSDFFWLRIIAFNLILLVGCLGARPISGQMWKRRQMVGGALVVDWVAWHAGIGFVLFLIVSSAFAPDDFIGWFAACGVQVIAGLLVVRAGLSLASIAQGDGIVDLGNKVRGPALLAASLGVIERMHAVSDPGTAVEIGRLRERVMYSIPRAAHVLGSEPYGRLCREIDALHEVAVGPDAAARVSDSIARVSVILDHLQADRQAAMQESWS